MSHFNHKYNIGPSRSKHNFLLSDITAYIFGLMCTHHQDDHEYKHKEVIKSAYCQIFSTLIFTYYVLLLLIYKKYIFTTQFNLHTYNFYNIKRFIYPETKYLFYIYYTIRNLQIFETLKPPSICGYFPFICIFAIILITAIYFLKYKSRNIW
jgi:hypothetical protein